MVFNPKSVLTISSTCNFIPTADSAFFLKNRISNTEFKIKGAGGVKLKFGGEKNLEINKGNEFSPGSKVHSRRKRPRLGGARGKVRLLRQQQRPAAYGQAGVGGL